MVARLSATSCIDTGLAAKFIRVTEQGVNEFALGTLVEEVPVTEISQFGVYIQGIPAVLLNNSAFQITPVIKVAIVSNEAFEQIFFMTAVSYKLSLLIKLSVTEI